MSSWRFLSKRAMSSRCVAVHFETGCSGLFIFFIHRSERSVSFALFVTHVTGFPSLSAISVVSFPDLSSVSIPFASSSGVKSSRCRFSVTVISCACVSVRFFLMMAGIWFHISLHAL